MVLRVLGVWGGGAAGIACTHNAHVNLTASASWGAVFCQSVSCPMVPVCCHRAEHPPLLHAPNKVVPSLLGQLTWTPSATSLAHYLEDAIRTPSTHAAVRQRCKGLRMSCVRL